MPITNVLAESFTGTNKTSQVFTSIATPSANVVLLASIATTGGTNGITADPSLAGCNLTWTLLARQASSSGIPGEQLMIFQGIGASPSSGSLTFTCAGTDNFTTIRISVDQSTAPNIISANTVKDFEEIDSTPDVNYAQAFASGSEAYAACAGWEADSTWTPKTGWTELSDGSDITAPGPFLMTETRAAGDTQAEGTAGTLTYTAIIAIELAGTSVPTEQTHFRYYNDDGSESAATGLAAEDTNINAVNDAVVRIRLQVDTSGDLGSTSFQLEAKLNSGTYQKVPITAPSQVVTTITTTGDGNFVVPDWVDTIDVECWGGGGAGGRRTTNGAGGGGAGGAYAKSTVSVTPGSSISYHVGAGAVQAASPSAGEDTTWNSTTVVAKGGTSVANNTATGATAPAASASTGTTRFKGGDGATGSTGSFGGGGGSSAGTGTDGNNGSSGSGGSAPTGGAAGGNGRSTTQGAGTSGSAPGGGGGGGLRISSGTQNGGSGAAGQLRLTYTPKPPIYLFASSNIGASGADATTARLSVPNSHSFTAGKISDDTNPVPAVDIGNNGYSEFEFNGKLNSAVLVNTDVISFRLTRSGSTLTTYTNVPTITVVPSGIPVTGDDAGVATDSVSYLLTLHPVADDAGIVSDTVTGTLSIPELINESGTIVDAASVVITPAGGNLQVTSDDAGVITDSAVAIIRIPVTINEAAVVVDANITEILYDLPDETGQVTDSITATLQIPVTINEDGVITETVSYLLRIPTPVNESGVLSDSVLYLLTIPNTVSESGVISDSVSVIINSDNSPILDGGVITDDASAVIFKAVTVSEAGVVIDQADPQFDNQEILTNISESGLAVDSASVKITFALVITESGIVDQTIVTNIPAIPGSHGGHRRHVIRRRRR